MRYLSVILWILLGCLYYWTWNNSNASCCGDNGISSDAMMDSSLENKNAEDTKVLSAEEIAAQKKKADEDATKAIEESEKTKSVTSVKSTDASGINKLTFYFPYNSSNSIFSSDTESDLDEIVKSIKSSGKKVIISGHTDNRGNPESNKNLGKSRAEDVKKKLVSKGLNASLVDTRSYGQEKPIESNDSSSGRQKNRRVELIIE